jgi:hypothetical protein
MKLWAILLTILSTFALSEADGRCLDSHHVSDETSWNRPLFILPFAICNSLFAINASLAVEDPVQSGRDALNRWLTYPWYDSSTDELQRVDVPTPPKPWSFNFHLGTFLQWFAWTVLVVLVILLIYFALKTFLGREEGASTDAAQKADSSTRDRIEALPYPIAVDQMNLLEEARRLYQQGNYSQAIVFLFSYQLVELDKRHCIRLTKGKTNRQYLREVGSRLSLRQLVEQTMIAFEDVFFGRHTLDQSRFESCWFRLGEFEKLNAEG